MQSQTQTPNPYHRIADFLVDTHDFSLNTFGPGPRTEGVLSHIGKELGEVRKEPDDMEEWIDLIILSFDGAMRRLTQEQGLQPYHAVNVLMDKWREKTDKNKARDWPDFRQFGQDQAIEHVRDEEMTNTTDASDEDQMIKFLKSLGATVHKIEATPLETVVVDG